MGGGLVAGWWWIGGWLAGPSVNALSMFNPPGTESSEVGQLWWCRTALSHLDGPSRWMVRLSFSVFFLHAREIVPRITLDVTQGSSVWRSLLGWWSLPLGASVAGEVSVFISG